MDNPLIRELLNKINIKLLSSEHNFPSMEGKELKQKKESIVLVFLKTLKRKSLLAICISVDRRSIVELQVATFILKCDFLNIHH